MTSSDNNPDNNNSDNDLEEVIEDAQGDSYQRDIELLPPEKVTRAGIGMKTALLLSIVAALAGAFGGAALSQALQLKEPDKFGEVQSQIQTIASERSGLASDIGKIKQDVDKLNAQNSVDVSQFEARLETIESQIPAASTDNYANVEARLGALENRPAVNADGEPIELPDDIARRLDALEQAQTQNQAPQQDLEEILDRIDRLEVKSVSTPVIVPAPKAAARTIVLPPLPRAEILASIQPDKSEGWLDRTMKKHVKVREAGAESPEAILDSVQALFDAGDYEGALEAFDRLPSPGRSAGEDWRKFVAEELESRE